MSLKQFILDLNRQRSTDFCSPEAQDALHLYQRNHPTRILVFKCMDGRINLPFIAGLPEGALQPFRNIGGKFDFGSPLLTDLVLTARRQAIRGGSRMLSLCTYHYSKGDTHRGCAGHLYDTDAAIAGAKTLKQQHERMFGKTNAVVAAIVVGIETDEDALIFHNGGDEQLLISEHADASDAEIERLLRSLYSRMHPEMLADLLPIALGNRNHVKMIRLQGRKPAELVHGENIIAVGRGFGWLHVPNKALIIGPYDYDWGKAVEVAGGLVAGNIAEGRAPKEDGVLLLVLTPFWEPEDRDAVAEKSLYIAQVSKNVLNKAYPDFDLDILVGVTDMRSRLIQEIDFSDETS
jgi:hypothetical protein